MRSDANNLIANTLVYYSAVYLCRELAAFNQRRSTPARRSNSQISKIIQGIIHGAEFHVDLC